MSEGEVPEETSLLGYPAERSCTCRTERRIVKLGVTQEFYGYSVEEILTLLRAMTDMSAGVDAVRYTPVGPEDIP